MNRFPLHISRNRQTQQVQNRRCDIGNIQALSLHGRAGLLPVAHNENAVLMNLADLQSEAVRLRLEAEEEELGQSEAVDEETGEEAVAELEEGDEAESGDEDEGEAGDA